MITTDPPDQNPDAPLDPAVAEAHTKRDLLFSKTDGFWKERINDLVSLVERVVGERDADRTVTLIFQRQLIEVGEQRDAAVRERDEAREAGKYYIEGSKHALAAKARAEEALRGAHSACCNCHPSLDDSRDTYQCRTGYADPYSTDATLAPRHAHPFIDPACLALRAAAAGEGE